MQKALTTSSDTWRLGTLKSKLRSLALRVALRLPGLAGVDLNSCFETAPGVKDAGRVGQMLTQLRSGATSL